MLQSVPNTGGRSGSKIGRNGGKLQGENEKPAIINHVFVERLAPDRLATLAG